MITSKEYYEITNCSDVTGFKIPGFTIEEVQQYLINRGYKIVIHEATATVHEVSMECGGGVVRTGNTSEEPRKAILAIKEGDTLPVHLSEANDLNFLSVFYTEIKKQLLGF